MESYSDIILYSAPNGDVIVEVYFEEETFWLSQKKMGELFNVGKPTIHHHLKEIYNIGELEEAATVRNFRTVQKEGERKVSRDITC